ncbi:MAG: hypothetical protein QM758_21050 [Armatimonas sp.]
MDDAQRTRGRWLHTRVVEGNTLSLEEQAELESYYAEIEATAPDVNHLRLERLESQNENLETLVARSEALVEYLCAVRHAA